MISTDIKRSFTNVTEITAKNLEAILFPMAMVDPQTLKYTQGMNFIAGYLYVLLNDEAEAFTVMKRVI